jgi:hypothetical protein
MPSFCPLPPFPDSRRFVHAPSPDDDSVPSHTGFIARTLLIETSDYKCKGPLICLSLDSPSKIDSPQSCQDPTIEVCRKIEDLVFRMVDAHTGSPSFDRFLP